MTKGFSLLELMITMVILAIALAVGAPILSGYTANQRIKNVSQLLIMDINYARDRAVTNRTNISISPRSANNWANGWQIRNAANTVLKLRDPLNSNVGLVAPAAGVTFNAQGWVTGGAAQFSIRNSAAADQNNSGCVGDRGRIISLSATGQLNVQNQSCANPNPNPGN